MESLPDACGFREDNPPEPPESPNKKDEGICGGCRHFQQRDDDKKVRCKVRLTAWQEKRTHYVETCYFHKRANPRPANGLDAFIKGVNKKCQLT